MNISDLPTGDFPKCIDYRHFPTRWQLFLWRNWGLVPAERLASILGCTVEQAKKAASDLGLPPAKKVSPKWLSHGYLTLIRKNWQILNYEQLLQLLGWTPEKLAYSLKEEDFLYHKLGNLKPNCPKVKYRELTPRQKAATAEIKKTIRKYIPKENNDYEEQPFSFAEKYRARSTAKGRQRFEFNFIHSYAASCGDVLGEADKLDPVPENLLAQYQSMGIKGIWIHALMYLLYPIPGAEEYSAGCEKRLANLKGIVKRCGKYGIQLYLYLNEPRCMPEAFYDKKPLWRGLRGKGNDTWCICTNRTREPLEWLESGLKWLFAEVPELGGIFCITQSENPTSCHSHTRSYECPYCGKVPPEKTLADVISAMERGMHASAPNARMIAYDWAWTRHIGDTDNAPFKKAIIDLLPKNIYINSVSEWGKVTDIGGVKQYLVDYSISQPGPSEEALEVWRHAQKAGLKTCAKVQLNNSWELSAVPYVPVPYLVEEHLENLEKAGVNGLMLSWTLGGYPGGNLELLKATPEEIAASRFHKKLAEQVCLAERQFSEAYRQFPFYVGVLYKAPMNYGPMNLLYLKPSGYKATMVGFPYDDLQGWRGVYPEEVFEQQFRLLIEGWQQGLETLKNATALVKKTEILDYIDLMTMAMASYCHLNSTYLQIKFVRARDNGFDKKTMAACVEQEIVMARLLYELVRCDSRIGFEASNHYYYTLGDLKEKIINCQMILDKLQ